MKNGFFVLIFMFQQLRLRIAEKTLPFEDKTAGLLPVCVVLSSFLIAGNLAGSCAEDAAKPRASMEFTKIQDLNPNQKPLNRPVRQKWAVVIGISKFRDKRLNTEQAYDKSARSFADYLQDPKGGRFRADHIRLLTDEAATQQNINNSFADTWLAKLAQPDDLVLVYIATRSFPTTDGNSYLCSYNCAMDNIYGSCSSLESLMQDLRSKIKSDRIVLVLESSYSGAAKLSADEKAGAGNFNIDLNRISLGKGLIILTSSRPDQLSWSNLFTENLIAALREKEGQVPLQEAFAKAQEKTEYDSLHRMYQSRKQTPMMKSAWQGNELVVGCAALEQNAAIPESALNFLGAEAHYLKANQLVINNEIGQAIKEYRAAIEADPALVDARADCAVALGLNGDWKEAESELRKAIALRPEDPLYLKNYARVLDKLGSKEESKKVLEKAYLLNPKDRVTLLALSDKCLETGDREMAMRLVDQALVLYPELASVHDRMCFLLSTQGRLDEAVAEAKAALKLDPELVSARLKLGALFLLKGNSDDALREYRLVIEKNAADFDARYLLAQALDKLNEKEKAAEEYRRFLELAPVSDRRRAEVQDRLKSLGYVI